MNAMRADIESRVLEVLAATLEKPATDFTDDSRFVEDHDGDSMSNMEIVANLELEFSIAIPDESLPEMVNLAGVRAALAKILPDYQAAEPDSPLPKGAL